MGLITHPADIPLRPLDGTKGRPEVREGTGAASLVPLFWPRSVAVVGASRDPAHIGSRVLEALRRSGHVIREWGADRATAARTP